MRVRAWSDRWQAPIRTVAARSYLDGAVAATLRTLKDEFEEVQLHLCSFRGIALEPLIQIIGAGEHALLYFCDGGKQLGMFGR
jgi:hypothetical protein